MDITPNQLIHDFTDRKNTQQRMFTIDDDTFHCAKVIPAAVGRVLATLVEADPIAQFDGMGQVLDMIMLPDSAQLFAERMQSPAKPISLDQVNEVLKWLMAQYGGGDDARPTMPSNDSLPSPVSTGSSSMGGQPLEAPTL